MNNPTPEPPTDWTIEELIDALNHMRDAWTRAALEMRDIQFGLDCAQRREAVECTNALVNRINPH